MSIADETLRVQINNRIMRSWLDPDDAIYWLNRAEKLLPDAKAKIIDLDSSKNEEDLSTSENEAAK